MDCESQSSAFPCRCDCGVLGSDPTWDRLRTSSSKAERTLDIHVHLFGTGDSGSGCRLSKATSESLHFKFLAGKLRLREPAKTLDEGYVLALAEQVEKSGLDKAVILAQDAVYDHDGKADWGKTPFYIPNDYLFQVVACYPERMIPCVSINPQRADAIAELDRCATKGAKVLKIHPPIQGVDLSEKRYVPFFRRCADLKMVVMVHTGHEHSAPIINAAIGEPSEARLGAGGGMHRGRVSLWDGLADRPRGHAPRFLGDDP